MIDHLYISIAIFAVALVTGLVAIYSGMALWRKLLIIFFLTLAGIGTYRAIFYFYGYPTILQKSFEDTLVVGFLVDKPNDVIYLWLQDDGGQQPRSYTIPFNNNTSKFLQKMQRKHKGKPFRAKIETETDQSSAYRDTVEDITIRELPVFPPKRR